VTSHDRAQLYSKGGDFTQAYHKKWGLLGSPRVCLLHSGSRSWSTLLHIFVKTLVTYLSPKLYLTITLFSSLYSLPRAKEFPERSIPVLLGWLQSDEVLQSWSLHLVEKSWYSGVSSLTPWALLQLPVSGPLVWHRWIYSKFFAAETLWLLKEKIIRAWEWIIPSLHEY
jgi:hypothetical protein